MPINIIIREKRKELGLTQEQIADCLGVSTPAVNKWESGASCPDITLLPALARLLKTDLNTLFCFDEGLSEQEISHFCIAVTDTIRKSDFKSGLELVIEKIQEYPNCSPLIHSAAMLLDGALIMSGMSNEEKEEYNSQILSLYKRAAKSDDEKIRNRAIYMLASKYTALEEFDKAQEMLDSLPESISEMDKGQLQANLWLKQGKLNEAAGLLEGKLYVMGVTEIQIIFMSLSDIALKEGREKDAFHLAEVSGEISKLFDLWDYYSFIAPLQLALAKKNVQESITLLNSMLSATLKPWDMGKSSLYRHIGVKAKQASSGKLMLPALLSELEHNPKYAFLQANEEFEQLINQYRAKC